MPILPIEPHDLDEPNATLAARIVEAVMFWPDDSGRRDQHIRAAEASIWNEHCRVLADEGGTFEMSAAALRYIRFELPTAPSIVDQRGEAMLAFRRGVAAGQIYLNALVDARRGQPVRLGAIKQHVAGLPGLLTGASTGTVENEIWKRFRPVAHLWAAFKIEWIEQAESRAPTPCAPHRLPVFLANAESLRLEGEQVRARHAGPLMPQNVAWRTAPEIKLPTVDLVLPEEAHGAA